MAHGKEVLMQIAERLVALEKNWRENGVSLEAGLGAEFLGEDIPGVPVPRSEWGLKRALRDRELALVLVGQGKLAEAEKVLLSFIKRCAQ